MTPYDFPEAPPMSEAEYAAFHAKRVSMMQSLLLRHAQNTLNKVLDVGGGGNVLGMGPFIKTHWDAEVHCVDLGDDHDRYAGDGIRYHQTDVDREPLPFEDKTFDLILFASIIEHLYNPAFALSECARVLKPHGLLLLEAPNAISFGRRIDVLKGRNPFRFFNASNTQCPKPPMFYCSLFYTVEEASKLIAADFELLEWRYGRHVPLLVWWKRFIHEITISLYPSMSDCFALIARRK